MTSSTESRLAIQTLSDYFSMSDIDKDNYKLEYFLKPKNVNQFHKHGFYTIYQLLGVFLTFCNDTTCKSELELKIPLFKSWLFDTISISNEKSIQFITDLVYNKIYNLF